MLPADRATWDVCLNTAEVVLIEDEGVLFFLCHYVQNLVFDVSYDKIFQNVEIVLHDDGIAVLKVHSVDLVG